MDAAQSNFINISELNSEEMLLTFLSKLCKLLS